MNFSSKIAIKTSWQSFSVESYAWTSQSSRITLIFINFLWSLRLVWTAQLFPQNCNKNLKISVNFFYLFKISVGFSWTKELMWKASVLHHTFMPTQLPRTLEQTSPRSFTWSPSQPSIKAGQACRFQGEAEELKSERASYVTISKYETSMLTNKLIGINSHCSKLNL